MNIIIKQRNRDGTCLISHSIAKGRIRLTKANYGLQNRKEKGSERVPFTQKKFVGQNYVFLSRWYKYGYDEVMKKRVSDGCVNCYRKDQVRVE